MWMSRSDLESSQRNEPIVLWIMVVGVVIGTYLAIFVCAP